ncbi:MAG: excinuclease ABC subunit UvrB [Bacteroidales bacterium]|nr:excinuclease ABC subunit UvrB [Bacteroidales bacterium]
MFQLTSSFTPSGDQPEAIRQLTEGINSGIRHHTLLGVTGSGKTFTIANVLANLQRPALVLSHNKTLAAQLYGEFKTFFPKNAIEYFVSYYDYYQPEAYLPSTDTYIEKDLSINEEIEKLRLSTISSLLSGRRDVVVVSSVSCLYGIGNPADFHENTIYVKRGMTINRNKFLHQLVSGLYFRSEHDFKRGTFRVKGDTIDIFLAYREKGCRVVFWGDDVEEISIFNPITNTVEEAIEEISIFPANIFVTTKENQQRAFDQILDDMHKQVGYFESTGHSVEAKRLENRVTYDLEMMNELGYCSGIENYSRYFDRRLPGTRPFCLLDCFPNDFITVIDESHVTIPQIHAMFGGDHSRKLNLVEYGFRLPAAIDNRPLRFEEFESLVNQTIYVSATPAEYELEKSEGIMVEQVIRPTGLLDPQIEIKSSLNQIDDLLENIRQCEEQNERVLVTTLTKRMAEELAKYMTRMGIRCRYIHSDVETLERVEIMEDLRAGRFDVLVGVNLLREGLDLPEVSLVAILDADKEGFLRSERSLTQTVGRAARNINGRVIMYADTVSESMQRTVDETNRRRKKQLEYNEKHHITPTQIVKALSSIMGNRTIHEMVGKNSKIYADSVFPDTVAADRVMRYMSRQDLENAIEHTKKNMQKASKYLDFLEAARLRDEMFALQRLLDGSKSQQKAKPRRR